MKLLRGGGTVSSRPSPPVAFRGRGEERGLYSQANGPLEGKLISGDFDSHIAPVVNSLLSLRFTFSQFLAFAGFVLCRLLYSRTLLFRSPKGNGKKFEIAGLRNNRGSVKGKGKSKGIRSSFEIAETSN